MTAIGDARDGGGADSGQGPNPTVLSQAAGSPHAARVFSLTVTSEIIVGVVIPLVLPAVVLATSRWIAVTDGLGAFRIDELAFGFAAVAVASLVRAASRGDWTWPGFILFSVLIVVWFACVGLGFSRASGVDEIVSSVHESSEEASTDLENASVRGEATIATAFLSELQSLDEDRLAADPGFWKWVFVLVPGILFAGAALSYIVKVRP